MNKKNIAGVVLKTIRYNENQLILHIYTKEFGRIAVMARRKKKAGGGNYFQPLFQLSLAVNFQEKKSIHHASSISFYIPYQTIPFSVVKNAIVQFLVEILEKVIPERQPDPELFDFLTHSLLLFDRTERNNHLFHLVFLIRLTRFLGFYPGDKNSHSTWFSPSEGTFVPQIMHDTIPQTLSAHFENLLQTPMSSYSKLKLPAEYQNDLLCYIVNIYKLQLNIKSLKSHEVLKQVFNH